MDTQQLWLGGRWESSSGEQVAVVVNPAGLAPVARVQLGTPDDMDRAVALARSTFESGVWRDRPPAARAQVLRDAADRLEKRLPELARLLTSELGCPLWFSERAHVPNPIRHLRYYADLIAERSFDDARSDGANNSIVVEEPVGVVGAITPWNGPLSSPTIKVAPALAAGCSVVVKPSRETPLTVMALGEALAEAGLPPGVLSIVPAGRDAGDRLIRHPDVDKIAFTGSTETGKMIMKACADRMARVTLELGGKSAAVVLPDADVDAMVKAILPMSLSVNGQLCIAQARVLVPRALEADARDALAAAITALKVGDPMDPETFIGPLVNATQRERVESYIDIARSEGAAVAAGGGRPQGTGDGWYVEPTLLAAVTNSMRVAQEEIFGPVIALIAYDDVDEAVRLANDSPYGLSGSVWSADVDAALAVARRIRTGMVSINGAPQAWGTPFGGYKQSGLGREMGPEGLQTYIEKKSIAMPRRTDDRLVGMVDA
jgi:betaine-aldehyde dehydrogenase